MGRLPPAQATGGGLKPGDLLVAEVEGIPGSHLQQAVRGSGFLGREADDGVEGTGSIPAQLLARIRLLTDPDRDEVEDLVGDSGWSGGQHH